MQWDDALDMGDLLARAIGTSLIVTEEVAGVAGAFRRSTKDYFRHMAGTGAARRCYFGESYMDLDSEFALGGLGREASGAMGRRLGWNEDIRTEIGFECDADEVDFEALLDAAGG